MRSSVSIGDWNEGRQRHWCVVASRFLRKPPGAAEASSCGTVSIIAIDYSYHLTGCHPSSKVNKYFFADRVPLSRCGCEEAQNFDNLPAISPDGSRQFPEVS